MYIVCVLFIAKHITATIACSGIGIEASKSTSAVEQIWLEVQCFKHDMHVNSNVLNTTTKMVTRKVRSYLFSIKTLRKPKRARCSGLDVELLYLEVFTFSLIDYYYNIKNDRRIIDQILQTTYN